MSKVLIDRAVLEATLEHAEFVSGAACEADDAIRAVLVAPSGTPVMPVKAYYHEAPNEHGGLNKSVGLEQRKTFADAPLVLESDALVQIACLEGEIAKRDARIVELEAWKAEEIQVMSPLMDYARAVCAGPLGSSITDWLVQDHKRLTAELAAIKAQEPVAVVGLYANEREPRLLSWNVLPDGEHRLYAAPAKATDGLRIGAWRDALEKIAKYAPAVNCAARTEIERIGLIAVHALIAFSAPQFSNPKVEANPAPAENGMPCAAPVAKPQVVMPSVDQAMRAVLREMGSSTHVRGTSNWCADVGRAVLDEVARLNGTGVDWWTPTWEKMPDSGRTVLAHYRNSHGKGRTIRAQYIKAWTVQAEDMADPDIECVEYSEQDDAYYMLEGWYECIDNWYDYSSVAVNEGTITHWMPLPAAPAQKVNP